MLKNLSNPRLAFVMLRSCSLFRIVVGKRSRDYRGNGEGTQKSYGDGERKRETNMGR